MKTKKANRHPFRRTRPTQTSPANDDDREVVVATHARSAPVLQFIMDMGEALQASKNGKGEPT